MALLDVNKIKQRTAEKRVQGQKVSPYILQKQAKLKLQNEREIADLEKVCGDLGLGETMLWNTFGKWSAHNLLRYMCQVNGPSKVTISSWTFSDDAVRTLNDLRDAGLITELHILSDYRLKSTKASVLSPLETVADQFLMGKNHSKSTAVINDDTGFFYIGSANMTKNPRLEMGILSRNYGGAKHTYELIRDELNRLEAGLDNATR